MLKLLVGVGFALGIVGSAATCAYATEGNSTSCVAGSLGGSILCGGQYVVPIPGAPSNSGPAPSTSGSSTTPTTAPPLTEYLANGPQGPCLALGYVNKVLTLPVLAWMATVHYGYCPTPAPGGPPLKPIDPATLALQFWKVIPLPIPRPAIPPGYAVTGMAAYLVTNGTVAPAPYVRNTPIGLLSIQATGTYWVDWGDGTAPEWAGPYSAEGRTWPDGDIAHTYDNVGRYLVTVVEQWSATWSLAGARGTLGGLHTQAALPGYPVQQLQGIITG